MLANSNSWQSPTTYYRGSACYRLRVKPRIGRPKEVYVGSTGDLQSRLRDHAKGQTNTTKCINSFLRKGYVLEGSWYRCDNVDEARRMERTYLDKYCFDCNKQLNDC